MYTELNVLIVYYVQWRHIFSWLMWHVHCMLAQQTPKIIFVLVHIYTTAFNGLNKPDILKIYFNWLC